MSPSHVVSSGSIGKSSPWALALLAVIVGIYAGSFGAPFLFDDAGAVQTNASIRKLTSLEVLQPPADGSTTTGRPLVNLSFALTHALGGGAPWAHRAGNVLLHAVAALLLWGILRRLLARVPAVRSVKGGSDTAAFFIALIWAVHPLQTESVVCIAQRTEVLCGVLYLLTLYAIVRAFDPGARSRRWQLASVGACLAGMAAKEVMVTAPVAVLLLDRTFLGGTVREAWRQRRFYYAALASTWLLLLALLLGAGGSRGVAAGFSLGVSPWHYLLTQTEALVRYICLSIWPHPLVLDYGTSVVTSPADVLLPGMAVVAALSGTIWALLRRRLIGVVGAWFFLLLAPSSSFVPLVTQTMAEHRMYLPLAALVGAGVIGLLAVTPRAAAMVLGGIAVSLSAATFARTADYGDELRIWATSVAAYPASARAHNNLALVLRHRGQEAEAEKHFAQAVRVDPAYASGHYNWGVALLEQGRPAQAVTQLEAALRVAPLHLDAMVNLGSALVRAGRAADAVPWFERADQLRPSADVAFNLGVACVDAGRLADARGHFERALRTDPGLVEGYFQLGRLDEAERRVAEAERHYENVLRLNPAHARAQARLGLLFARSERWEGALIHLQEAVRLAPQEADARANLGNVLLVVGRPREAVAQFEEALQLRPGDVRLQASLEQARRALR